MTTITSLVRKIERDMGDRGNTLLTPVDYQGCASQALGDYSGVYPLTGRKILSIQKECHAYTDSTNTIAAASCSDYATSYTLLNEIKADFNLHIADADYHKAADSTNTISTADATTEATARALAIAIKDALNAHCIQSGVHYVDDTVNVVTSLDCTDETTTVTLANEEKSDYTNHLSEESDGRTLDITDVTTTTGYIDVIGVEYPVEKWPPQKPDFERITSTLIHINTNQEPDDTGELVYVYYKYAHTLSSSASTLPSAADENLIVKGATGYALMMLARKRRREASEVWTSQAYHLTSADGTIVAKSFQDYIEAADARFTDMDTQQDAALGHLSNFDTRMTAAVARITDLDTQLSNALTKITTGSDAHDADMTLARAELEIAEGYLETGDDKITTIGVGRNEAGMYAQYAQAEIALANGMASMAAAERAASYLHVRLAQGEIEGIQAELSMARSNLSAASQELSVGQQELAGAGAGLRMAGLELSAARMWAEKRSALMSEADRHQKDGMAMLAEFRAEIERLKRQKAVLQKPKSTFTQMYLS